MNSTPRSPRTPATTDRPVSSTSHPGAPGRRAWAALAVLALGLAMIVIDGTIVSVALPTIIADLRLDLTEAQWLNGSYAVVFSALLLVAGRLGDRFGRRRLFVFGIVVFVAGSVLAALSGIGTVLIAARIIQGVGGAAILPATLSTVNATFTGRSRAAAFGVWGAVMAGAAAIGPLLGGWLTSSFAWPLIFWVNVPLGLLLLIGAAVFVPKTRSDRVVPGVDVLGLLLSAFGLGLLVFGLIESSDLPWALGLVPVGLLLVVVFVLWELRCTRRGQSALLDVGLFRIPSFSWGNLTALAVAVGEFGLLLVLPLFLVNVLGLGVLQTGFVLAGMAGGAFLSGTLARHLATAVGAATTVIIGLVLEVASVGVLVAVLDRQVSPLLIAGVLVAYGLGLGLASAQLTSTVLARVPTDESGAGSATQSTVRQIGSALGTAVAGALLAVAVNATLADGAYARFADPLRESAGGLLVQLRAQHAAPGEIAALADAFTTATQISLVGAAVFLLLGLLGSLRVARTVRTPAPVEPVDPNAG